MMCKMGQNGKGGLRYFKKLMEKQDKMTCDMAQGHPTLLCDTLLRYKKQA